MKTILPSISIFGAIEKVARQPDGTLLVSAVVSSEAVDDQGEIVTYDALKKAAPGYMEWAPVNEMHKASAVGTTVELLLDDAGHRGLATLHVVDPLAVQKVEAGVYKGVSIEGAKNTWEMAKVAGRSVRRVTDITWKRLSLVDRPSNPDAILTLAKRSAEAQMDTDTPEAVESSDEPTTDELAKASPTDKEREEMPDTDFVFPDEKAFPVTDEAGIADAVASWGRYKGPHSFEEFKDALTALAKKKGWENGLPEKWDEPAKEEETAKMSESGDLAKATFDLPDGMSIDDLRTGIDKALKAAGIVDDHAWIVDVLPTEFVYSSGDSDYFQMSWQSNGEGLVVSGAPTPVRRGEWTPIPVVATTATSPVDVVDDLTLASPVDGDLAKGTGERVLSGDELAKIGKRNAGADEAKIKQIMALCQELIGSESSEEGEPTEKMSSIPDNTETLAKMTDVLGRLADLPRKEDLDAVQAAMLEGLTPLKEQVAQMAKMAAPGGPVRYAERDGRLVGTGEASSDGNDEEAILAKMSATTQNPVLKAALGERLALLQIQQSTPKR
jgi:hypothetical protein